MKKRNAAVELLRIFGCLMVIGNHLYLSPAEAPEDLFRMLFAALVMDGVAVFFVILGFFYFSGEYGKSLKKVWWKVLVPALVFTALMFYFGRFITGTPFLESISRAPYEYKAELLNLLKWKPSEGTPHLWYVYVYVVVILLLPAFRGLRDFVLKWKWGDLVLFGILFAALVANDLLQNQLLEEAHHALQGALTAFAFVFAGDVLWRRKETIEKSAFGLLGLAGTIIVLVLRVLLQYLDLMHGHRLVDPMFYSTSFGFAGTVCFTVFVLWLFKRLEERPRISAVIRHLGSRTFYVYVCHGIALNGAPFRPLWIWTRSAFGETGGLAFLGQCIAVLLVFLMSLAFSELVTGLFWAVRKIVKRAK